MFDHYSAATRIIPIVGDPIAQAKSPRGLTLAFDQKGHDIIVVPVHLKPSDVQAFLQAMGKAQNVVGMLATVPHKFAAFQFSDTASERATFFRSGNALKRSADGGWYCDMLDGLGYIRALEATGIHLAGHRALLVGAGGAGSAIALELLNAGVSRLAVHDADAARQRSLLDKLNVVHPGKAIAGSADPAGFTLVVNATPSGMNADDPHPVDLDRLRPGVIAGDVITSPEITPLLRKAQSMGATVVTGIDMFNNSIDLMVEFFLSP